MTEDPAEFLTTQYDEEQRLAEAIAEWGVSVVDPYGYLNATIAEFIETNSPARALAEIAAKRQLLELWQEMDAHDNPMVGQCADRLLEQLLAPYGKRAVFTRDSGSGPLSWRLEDDPARVEG